MNGLSTLLRMPSPRGLLTLPSAALAVALVGSLPAPVAGQERSPAAYDREVRELLGLPEVRAAMEAIVQMDEGMEEELIALTQIPAPPFQEEERARAFAELLREAGADSVVLDEVGNVLGFRGGRVGDRTVVLGAHLDTVFPEGTDVTVRVRGDTLFAPGVGDDTRGLIVILNILRALERTGVETDANLIFLGSVGEEGLGDLRGVKHFFGPQGVGGDALIEVDGSGLSSIVSMGLGSYRYRVTFHGPGGHSWGAFGTVNPAHALGRAVALFAAAGDSLTLSGPRTSFNVGRIGGGTSINSIPFEAWMEVDMRSESPRALDRMDEAFLAAVARALEEENAFRREGARLEVDVDRIGSRPSGETDPANPLVQRAMAVTRYMGEEPSLSRSSTNANIPIAMGIPAVTVGRGGVGADNHSPSEWWMNTDGYKGIQCALLILLAEAGVRSSPGA